MGIVGNGKDVNRIEWRRGLRRCARLGSRRRRIVKLFVQRLVHNLASQMLVEETEEAEKAYEVPKNQKGVRSYRNYCTLAEFPCHVNVFYRMSALEQPHCG